MLADLDFKVDCAATEKRQKVWRRVVKSPQLTVPKVAEFSQSDEVLAIGSCFANEIRAVLERVGVVVHPTIDPQLGELFLDEFKTAPRWGTWDERVHYQCFTPFTIRQEVEFALEARQPDPEAIYPCRIKGQELLLDPYRRAVYSKTRENLLEIRTRMSRRMQQGIAAAKIIVITLGLVEAFKLVGREDYLSEYNSHIGDEHLEFVNASYEQAHEALAQTIELLRSHYPEKMIAITVSPIPVARTFSDTNAITATMRGKSILRSCADAMAAQYENVHYWPSYEFAMWSGNAFAAADVRHIRPEAIAKITSAFCHAYFNDSLARQVDQLATPGDTGHHGKVLPWPKFMKRLRRAS